MYTQSSRRSLKKHLEVLINYCNQGFIWGGGGGGGGCPGISHPQPKFPPSSRIGLGSHASKPLNIDSVRNTGNEIHYAAYYAHTCMLQVVSQYSNQLAPLSVDAVLKVIDPATATNVDLRDIKVIKKLG